MAQRFRVRAHPRERPPENPQNPGRMLRTVHAPRGSPRRRSPPRRLLRRTARRSLQVLQAPRLRREDPLENHREQGLPHVPRAGRRKDCGLLLLALFCEREKFQGQNCRLSLQGQGNRKTPGTRRHKSRLRFGDACFRHDFPGKLCLAGIFQGRKRSQDCRNS